MQCTGAAKGEHGELTRINAALNGHHTNRTHHVRVDHAQDAFRHFLHGYPCGGAELLRNRTSGALNIQSHFSAQQFSAQTA